MPSKTIHIIFITVISGLAWVISFPLNEWFSATMPRHQLLQLPAMLLLGILAGLRYSRLIPIRFPWDVALLIFIMASLVFWMLPRSIDTAVIHPAFNRLMHVTMLAAGFLTITVLRQTIFEIRIAFMAMVSVMVFVTGMTLVTFNILLCSSFNIEQQKETGLRLLITGMFFAAGTLFTFFSGLGKKT